MSLPSTIKLATSVADIYQGMCDGILLPLPCIVLKTLWQSHYEAAIFNPTRKVKRECFSKNVGFHFIVFSHTSTVNCQLSDFFLPVVSSGWLGAVVAASITKLDYVVWHQIPLSFHDYTSNNLHFKVLNVCLMLLSILSNPLESLVQALDPLDIGLDATMTRKTLTNKIKQFSTLTKQIVEKWGFLQSTWVLPLWS